MANFTGTAGTDVANATTSVLTGFTGGTLAELKDGVGDSINGLAGDDTIVAGSGADTITDQQGASTTIDAGLGDDVIDIAGSKFTSGSIKGGGGTDTLQAGSGTVSLAGLTLTEIEILHTGGGFTVLARAAQFDAFNIIRTGTASPTETIDLALVATGSPTTLDLSDELAGGGGPRAVNKLVASSDDETITTGAGNDGVFAGSGNDTVNGGLGNDALNGEAGNDTLNGGDGNDVLNGGTDNDVLNGGDGADTITDNQGCRFALRSDPGGA
jgi:Ca2+-binding RTX toxin-like protein